MKKPSAFQYDLAMRAVKAVNVILLTVPFACCWYMAYADKIASPYYARGNYLMIAFYAILYFTYGRIYEAFLISMNPLSEMIYSQGLAALVSNAILYFVIWLLSKHLPNPLPLLGVFALQIGLSAAWSAAARRWYFRTWPARRTLIIYDRREDMEQLLEEPNMRKKFTVVGRMHVEEALAGMPLDLEGVDTAFLCGLHSHARNILLKEFIAANVAAYITPCVGDVLMQSAHPIHMFHLPVMRAKRCQPDPIYLFIKRAMDLCISALALLITAPILLITALAIKLTDGGPVFYKQCRLTKDGRAFQIYKFRSMRTDAEKDGVARLSTGSADDRVTPVGKIIRMVRIDELPQLLNILKGDMALVGPRPERPEIAAQYCEALPEFALRLQVKAGLTGYAQVHGKYNTSPYDKLQMDLIYIANLGIAQDLRILFATVKILFTSESTEGIEEGKTTAQSKELREILQQR